MEGLGHMKRETVDKANEIIEQIKQLNLEITELSYKTPSKLFRRYRYTICSRWYENPRTDKEFKMTNEDREALIGLRKKKVKELEEELEKM